MIRGENGESVASSVGYFVGLALAISVGVFLRLYLLPGQILLDDEWHAMNYAANVNSVFELLTHFSLNLATCIPQNAYTYLLLKTVGWNETWLRLPSIIAGILGLMLFPAYIRSTFNRRTTLIFSALLAISPFLVFYSRMARPYCIVTLLAFTSLWAAYSWAIKRTKKYAVLYAISAILAIYFHLFAAVGVLVPLLAVFIDLLRDKFGRRDTNVPTTSPGHGAMMIAGLLVIAVATLFTISGILSHASSDLIGKDHITTGTLSGFLSLLAGTSRPVYIVIFIGLLGLGLVNLYKDNKSLLANIFVLGFVAYLLAFALAKPQSIHAPIVFSRYSIILFPLCFLVVAVGIDHFLTYFDSHLLRFPPLGAALNLGWVVFVAALFAAGPLPGLYSSTNNFTNHAAFQESYKPLDWDRSYTSDTQTQICYVRKEDIPAFYFQLANEPAGTIIEYPMSFVNQFNLFYYYQHFHRKRVIGGYLAKVDLTKQFYVIWMDVALSLVGEPHRFHFRNLINLDDVDVIKSSGAKYLILHPNLLNGEWRQTADFPRQDYSALIGSLREKFIPIFGLPVFWDKNVIVFKTTSKNDQ